MKIHFAAVIGVEYDLDLAPYWIEHYKARNLDSYTVFLHKETGGIPEAVQKLYTDAGFKVICIDGYYNDGRGPAFYLQNFTRNLNPKDFIVIADADEFQVNADNSPIDYRDLCENRKYDILHGLFEERFSDSLEPCYKNPFVQYYNKEPYTGDFVKAFSPPFLSQFEWPPVFRTKIVCARAGESFRFLGAHNFYYVSSKAKILFGCKVVHFSWREGAAKKLSMKSYYKSALRKALGDTHALLTDIQKITSEFSPEAKEFYDKVERNERIEHALSN